jgi:hypothetical protein
MKIGFIGASGGMEIGPRLKSPLSPYFTGYYYNDEIKGKSMAMVSVLNWMSRPSSPKKTL